jgi:hypothetical protein
MARPGCEKLGVIGGALVIFTGAVLISAASTSEAGHGNALRGIAAALGAGLLGGFMWVVGDLFQNYATKYVGISRGIPLSNTNQLWGLLWAILVFRELHGPTGAVYAEVIGGSCLMAAGAVAIACSSASEEEYSRWKEAAQREVKLYGTNPQYVTERMEGREGGSNGAGRRWID